MPEHGLERGADGPGKREQEAAAGRAASLEWAGLRWPSLWAPVGVFAAAVVFGLALMAIVLGGLSLARKAPDLVTLALYSQVAFMSILILLCLATMARTNRSSLGDVLRAGARLERHDLLLVLVLLGLILAADIPLGAFLSRFGPVLDEPSVRLLRHPAMTLVAFTLGPVAEELWGRGLVYGALLRWGAWSAILGTTVITSLIHFNLLQAVAVMPGMFALSWLRHRTKRLAPSVVLHSANNLIAVAVLVLSGEV